MWYDVLRHCNFGSAYYMGIICLGQMGWPPIRHRKKKGYQDRSIPDNGYRYYSYINCNILSKVTLTPSLTFSFKYWLLYKNHVLKILLNDNFSFRFLG